MDKDLCERLILLSKNFVWGRYDVYSPQGRWFHFDYSRLSGDLPEFKEVEDFVEATIPQYPNRVLGKARLNRYHPGDFTETHQDAADDRKYTLLIQISDPNSYEGGDLIVNGETISKEQGTCVIFNSQTDDHSVLTVTKGYRYSIVNWAHQIPLDSNAN